MADKDLYVVCTGDHFTAEENSYFEALDIKDQLKIIFVDDAELLGLYKSAQMFIYPSYYEGFGIPILEAFQAECPVVLSNGSCFPEVAGDVGVYFDFKSPQQLRTAVLSLLNDKEYRQKMIRKGKQRLHHFSWEKSALQTVEIYKKVLNKM